MARPNIIFIVADDLGFADLGCYGGRVPVSPVLDSLAANGIRFTQGYSNSPVCSPTRFAMITGRYQYRLRGAAEEPINSKSRGSTTLGLPTDHPTLPSLLKASGYNTALIGKWHLGYPPAFGPLRSGYDEFFGPMSGGVDYFTHCSSNGSHDLYFGEEEHREEGYLTDLISRRSVDYVNRMAADAKAGKPFFLVFWSRDPDGTQHNNGDSFGKLTPGINGETSLRAITNADDSLRQWQVLDLIVAQGTLVIERVVDRSIGIGGAGGTTGIGAAVRTTLADQGHEVFNVDYKGGDICTS